MKLCQIIVLTLMCCSETVPIWQYQSIPQISRSQWDKSESQPMSFWGIANGVNQHEHASSPPQTDSTNDAIDEEVRQIGVAWPSIRSPDSFHKRMPNSANATVRVMRPHGTHGLTCVPECTGNLEDVVEPFYRYRFHPFKIPFFEVPEATRFWSGSSAKECLRGKTILLLGDSTMGESVEDLLLLLTGDVASVDNFAKSVTRVSPQPRELTWSSQLGHVVASFLHTHRNLTISMPNDKIVLKYRFTGHANLDENMMGIKTFLNEAVASEIRGYISALHPDVIIVNSGLHDVHVSNFKKYFPMVVDEHVMPWLEAGIKVIWKGNNYFGSGSELSEMDLYVKDVLAGTGAKWVGVNDVLLGLSNITLADMPSFPHIGMIAKYHDAQASIFPSQFVTFKLLDMICKDV